MATPRTTAQKLVSESEFKLINESFPPLVGALKDKALLQRMERARKARDKYHAMAEKQRSSARPSADIKDVESKEKIFDEALARFERCAAKAGSNAGLQADAPATSARNPANQAQVGKKPEAKHSAQATSKASVKMANKAAAKGAKVPVPKAGKGKGGATKQTPRGRHGAAVPSTMLR